MRRFSVIVVAAAFSAIPSLLFAQSAASLFAPVLPTLRAKTHGVIPIYLPTYFPPRGGKSAKLIADVLYANATGYEVDLGTCLKPELHPGCNYGSVQETKIISPATGSIPLANGASASYQDGAAIMSPLSNIGWDFNGHFYGIELVHGTQAELVRMANSMRRY
jgi:hypothetical protein